MSLRLVDGLVVLTHTDTRSDRKRGRRRERGVAAPGVGIAAGGVARSIVMSSSPSPHPTIPNAGFAWQQLDIASFRAVEQRRWLVRVSDSGPSAVVDPFGRVVAHTEALTRDALVAEIAPMVDPSPYGRVGDLFGVTCGIVAAVALGLESRRDRAKL